MNRSQPRGIRNNNPGNIRWGSNWQGLVPEVDRTDDSFCQFVSPTWGIRALARTLITYYDKRISSDGSPVDTVAEIIERWAPPGENDTEGYIRAAVQQTGFAADQVLDMHCYNDMRPVVEAIIRHECGVGPLKNANTWYNMDVIDEGLHLAGVVKRNPSAGIIPVTPETVGASGAGAVGMLQLTDVATSTLGAARGVEDHFTSGDWVRIAFGITVIALAAYITWSQIRKHQKGLVK